MKVHELIELLKTFPQDHEAVYIVEDAIGHHVEPVTHAKVFNKNEHGYASTDNHNHEKVVIHSNWS